MDMILGIKWIDDLRKIFKVMRLKRLFIISQVIIKFQLDYLIMIFE